MISSFLHRSALPEKACVYDILSDKHLLPVLSAKELRRIQNPVRVHLAQAKCYAYIYAKECERIILMKIFHFFCFYMAVCHTHTNLIQSAFLCINIVSCRSWIKTELGSGGIRYYNRRKGGRHYRQRVGNAFGKNRRSFPKKAGTCLKINSTSCRTDT